MESQVIGSPSKTSPAVRTPAPDVGAAPPEAATVPEQVVDTPFGRFHGHRGDLISRQLREFGGHTRNELAMILSFVAAGDVILDVGGHIGTFAIPLARKVGEQGRVFAFEALRANHDFLQRNVRVNDLTDIVHVENVAVSDRRETLHCEPTDGNSGATYLTRDSAGEMVDTILLDEWWAGKAPGGRHHVSLIKIDTEGMELRVLKGCANILERDKPVLYFEFSPANLRRAGASVGELEDFLATHGYHYFVNLGRRNSSHDHFALGRIRAPHDLGSFGDVLAFHPSSLRYPSYFAGPAYSWCRLRAMELLAPPVRMLRKALGRGRAA